MENETADEEYQQLLNAGTDDSSLEIAEENLTKFFPDIPLEDALELLQSNKMFTELLHMVRKAFIKWYHWDPGQITINTK